MSDQQAVALLLEYEGTAYAGFQVQPGQPTVQGELESALRQLLQHEVKVRGASRTDAGVHALGQVVAFPLPRPMPLSNLVHGLNYHLPKDIAVRDACKAPDAFDPRREALWRSYQYTILLRRSRSALWRGSAYQVAEQLDWDSMAWGASLIRGERDWSTFAAALSPRRNPMRRIESTTLCRSGERLTINMTANAFLPQQVRRTVGALLRLGRVKLTRDEFAALVDHGRPGQASWVAPARGLCLTHIEYGEKLHFSGTYHEDVSG
jgi:tRNA pseudouridine38-40 synthase